MELTPTLMAGLFIALYYKEKASHWIELNGLIFVIVCIWSANGFLKTQNFATISILTKHPMNLTNSVGIVRPYAVDFDQSIVLESGQVLAGFRLMVETYGTLNTDKSNAILICHALSGSHHAAGYHSENDKKAGWWDNFIGPNKAIDTNRFFVVCLNNIGSCYGSTGPTSINPETAQAFGADFPLVTIKDWVLTQKMLADRLKIDIWHAVVGGSMGGMQALKWAIDFPTRLKKCVVIASTPKLSAQNIAFNEVARQSILSDPNFDGGYYLHTGKIPKHGLILARMLGHITYLTDKAMKVKFGRELKAGKLKFNYEVDFEVESYLRHQGKEFSTRFDANSYLLMTKALDYFDPARGMASDDLDDQSTLQLALAHTTCQFLVISFTSDWRFAPERSVEIVDALVANKKPVSYINIDAPHGHDSFLFDIPLYHQSVANFLQAKTTQYPTKP